MFKSVSLFSGLALVGVLACTKKEQTPTPIDGGGETPKEITRDALVGSYLVTKVEGRSGDQRTDITETWFKMYAGECAKDDITEFRPDASFIVQDGRIECDETTDDTGTWKLLSKSQLKLDADTAEIEAFTANTMRIVSPIYSTAQSAVVFTYTRQ